MMGYGALESNIDQGARGKNNKQFLKIDPGTQKKRGMLNVIKQLQHFILCNMMCYGAMKSNIDRGLAPWYRLLLLRIGNTISSLRCLEERWNVIFNYRDFFAR
jgi:hypothetical protein